MQQEVFFRIPLHRLERYMLVSRFHMRAKSPTMLFDTEFTVGTLLCLCIGLTITVLILLSFLSSRQSCSSSVK